MYAVIETGGKQYRVEPGDVLDVERLRATGDVDESADAEASESADAEVVFDRVLMVGGGDGEPVIGTPTVDGANVVADRVGDVRGPKVIVFKKKRRKGYQRKNGHRQNLLRVRIRDINV